MTVNLPRRPAAVIAAVGLVLVVGAVAVTESASLALATRKPDTALTLDPNNSIALASRALRDVQLAKTPAQRDAAAGLARKAISRDAANSTALSALALATADPARAARLLIVSEQMSRRSLLTQLALIEQSVARNDVPGALKHYDIALRTSSGSASILFPVLVEATADANLLVPIATMLAARPSWGELFLQQLAQSGTALGNITRLFTTLIGMNILPNDAATTAFYQRLLGAHDYGHAWAFYAAANPDAVRGGIRNGGFTANPAAPAPFDWSPSVDGPVIGEVRNDAGGQGELTFVTNISDGGTVARQLLLLAPGRHVLRGVGQAVSAKAPAGPYLQLSCATTAAEIGRQAVGNGPFEFTFTVLPGCVAQWLSLMVKAPETSEPIKGAFRSLHLD